MQTDIYMNHGRKQIESARKSPKVRMCMMHALPDTPRAIGKHSQSWRQMWCRVRLDSASAMIAVSAWCPHQALRPKQA